MASRKIFQHFLHFLPALPPCLYLLISNHTVFLGINLYLGVFQKAEKLTPANLFQIEREKPYDDIYKFICIYKPCIPRHKKETKFNIFTLK